MKTRSDITDRNAPPEFSKRASRRLIQRAFVLLGRDKQMRQHIREARLSSLWVIEDMGLTWTVVLDRGKFEFERRPAKNPDARLSWDTSEEFFRKAAGLASDEETLHWEGTPQMRRFFEPILRGLFESLQHVLAYPVDDMGESLL